MFKEIETSELVFKANIVATHLKDIGFYAEHEIVVNLLQQRAELLEALKEAERYLTSDKVRSNATDSSAAKKVNSAISTVEQQ